MAGAFDSRLYVAIDAVWNRRRGGRIDVNSAACVGGILRSGLMSISFDEAENLLGEIQESLEKLKKIRVKLDVLPVPVVRDGKGRLVHDYNIRDWMLKIREEDYEFEAEAMLIGPDDSKPWEKEISLKHKYKLAEEFCDTIIVRRSFLQQCGIDDNFLIAAMHNKNVKNFNRGYMNDQGGEDSSNE